MTTHSLSASRRLSLLALAAFALSTAASQAVDPAAAAKLKIGTVDMQRVFKEYYKTIAATKEVRETSKKFEDDVENRKKRLADLKTELDKMKAQLDDTSIADAKKGPIYQQYQLKGQEGQALQRDLQETVENSRKVLNENMVNSMKSILDEIQSEITTESKSDDYDYVFDKSGLSTSQVPFLLYTKDAIDMTPALIEKLNKDAPPVTETKQDAKETKDKKDPKETKTPGAKPAGH